MNNNNEEKEQAMKKREDVKLEGGELVCVRHCATGLYLEMRRSHGRISARAAGDDGAPHDVLWCWQDDQADASILERAAAERAAAAYIALTGDSGVEIEPVEEVEL